MLLDIAHQELDCKDGNHKCNHHTDYQNQYLCSCKSKAEFQQLQKAGSEHNRNAKEEGKLSCNGTGGTNQDSSDNGGTGSGSSRNNRKNLEAANQKCSLESQIFQTCALRLSAFVVVFHNDKQNTVDN